MNRIDLTESDLPTRKLELAFESRVAPNQGINLIQHLECPVCKCIIQRAHGWRDCKHLVCVWCVNSMSPDMAARGCIMCHREDGAAKPKPDMDRMIECLQVVCPHPDCGSVYELGPEEWKNEREHSKTCRKAVETCEACHEQVLRTEKEHHKASICSARTIACHHCEEQVPHQQYAAHLAAGVDTMCAGLVECVCCNTDSEDLRPAKKQRVNEAAASAVVKRRVIVRRANLAYHLADECPRRLVQCDLCPEKVEARKLSHHLLSSKSIVQHFATMNDRMVSLQEPPPAVVTELPSDYRRVYSATVLLSPDEIHKRKVYHHTVRQDDGEFKGPNLLIKTGHRNRHACDRIDVEFGYRADPAAMEDNDHHHSWAVSLGIVEKWRDGDAECDADGNGFNIGHTPRHRIFARFDTTGQSEIDLHIGSFKQDMFDASDADLCIETNPPYDDKREFGVYVQIWRKF